MPAPIFIYHAFYKETELPAGVPARESRYYLPQARLEEHLAFLAANHFQAPSLPEFLANPCSNAVVLTFDDGHISNYEAAFPALASRGFHGTLFIVAGWIGQAGRISAPQLRELDRHGMAIASHGLTHTPLTQLAPKELAAELRDSRDILQQILGAPVLHLAVPGGFANRAVLQSAREAGYEYICTSIPGLARSHWLLPRLSITSHTSLRDFQKLARQDPSYLRKVRLLHSARQAVKSLIGVTFYEQVQRRLFERGPIMNK
jgi:peptidoglycan/xylan/chitin deacetylase (PgdA/CDA1 family)